MRGVRTFPAISAATGAIVLSFVASASAATVVYTSGDVPKTFDDDQIVASNLNVPSGRTPAAEVEVVSAQVSTPVGSVDRAVLLRAPNGQVATLVPSGCDSFSLNANFDEQAGGPFNTGTDCNAPAGTTFKPTTPFAPLLGPSGGTWALLASDPGNLQSADPGQISAWSLRVTHAPFVFTVTAKAQPLRKKVKLSASCNTKCTITSSGDVKTRQLVQAQGVNAKFKLPLKKRAFERLDDDGGKAKFTLVASNGYGDVSTQKVKIRFPG
jgi:hypothetical protein